MNLQDLRLTKEGKLLLLSLLKKLILMLIDVVVDRNSEMHSGKLRRQAGVAE